MQARALPSTASVICVVVSPNLPFFFYGASFFWLAAHSPNHTCTLRPELFYTVLDARKGGSFGVRSNGLCPQSVFAAAGCACKSLFAQEASSAIACSERERKAREAAAILVLSTVLHSMRMETRVLRPYTVPTALAALSL